MIPAASACALASVVQRRHHLDRRRADLAGRLVPGVEHAGADRLGQAERQAGPPGVDPQQRGRVRGAGHGHAVLRLGVVDAVPPGHRAVRRAPHRHTAAQYLRRQLHRELVARPAEQVQRDQRHAAHRVDVGQGIGGGDPPEGIGVVHDGGEEVRGHHDRHGRADPHHGAVVAVLHTHQQVRARAAGHQGGYRLLKLARRDLAGAAAAARILREPEPIQTGHAAQCSPRPDGSRRAPGMAEAGGAR